MIDVSQYDFLDIGASKGGSTEFASTTFGGKGLGVDIDPAKIAKLKERGFDGLVADAANLSLPDKSVDYTVMMNFLEHLPSRDVAAAIIKQAARVSRKFVYIYGPNFDDLDYLASVGLKKFYADWPVYHTWHHTRDELAEIAKSLDLPFTIVETERLRRSTHKYLLPMKTDPQQNYYDSDIHPPKKDFRLKQKVYGWITMIVETGDSNSLDIFATANGFRVSR